MTEVEVRNFQSVEHAKIVVEGYTALVGRSNIGKSALVRAINAALTGAAGTSFVRHGSNCARRTKDAKSCHCKSSVRIKREGFDLLWEKGDHINSYTFNGTLWPSAERGTPSFLMGEYAPIKVGDSKALLQVADQFHPIFLLDETGGVVADVLSDVAHLDRINVAMRLVEKDRRDATATRKVREQDILGLSETLTQYVGLDDAVNRVRAAEAQLSKLDSAEARWRQIARFVEEGNARGVEIKRLMGVTAIAEPDAKGLRDGSEAVLRLSVWHDRLTTMKDWFDRAQPVRTLTAPDYAPLKEQLAAVGVLAGYTAKLEALTQEVTRVEVAHAKVLEDVERVRVEWEDLGVCPTCEQACSGHAVALAV
jgi:hypothetical protein